MWYLLLLGVVVIGLGHLMCMDCMRQCQLLCIATCIDLDASDLNAVCAQAAVVSYACDNILSTDSIDIMKSAEISYTMSLTWMHSFSHMDAFVRIMV